MTLAGRSPKTEYSFRLDVSGYQNTIVITRCRVSREDATNIVHQVAKWIADVEGASGLPNGVDNQQSDEDDEYYRSRRYVMHKSMTKFGEQSEDPTYVLYITFSNAIRKYQRLPKDAEPISRSRWGHVLGCKICHLYHSTKVHGDPDTQLASDSLAVPRMLNCPAVAAKSTVV